MGTTIYIIKVYNLFVQIHLWIWFVVFMVCKSCLGINFIIMHNQINSRFSLWTIWVYIFGASFWLTCTFEYIGKQLTLAKWIGIAESCQMSIDGIFESFRQFWMHMLLRLFCIGNKEFLLA
jgi:hypothetical protein